MSGITFGRWVRVLIDNRFDIDFPYWGRAAVTTFVSLYNSTLRQIENGLYKRRVQETEIRSPLFILGMFRSGTTYLHYLFAQDDHFAYPNLYQVMFPHSFLCSERVCSTILKHFVPGKRPQDQMQFGLSLPNEDELALCGLIGRSNNLDHAFGRAFEFNRRYFTLQELSDSELEEWMTALKWFVQKLTYKYQRPLVLKSPGHTGRISTLLKLFPAARFVHIRRNPYAVFQSWITMIRRISPWWQFQRMDFDKMEDDVLSIYSVIYDVFLEQRDLIPEGHLCEVNYEDVIADPVVQMRNIYDALALPSFEQVEPSLTAYVSDTSGYKASNYPELSSARRERISREWHRFFEAWGYPT